VATLSYTATTSSVSRLRRPNETHLPKCGSSVLKIINASGATTQSTNPPSNAAARNRSCRLWEVNQSLNSGSYDYPLEYSERFLVITKSLEEILE
jgi:hypothetical protein